MEQSIEFLTFLANVERLSEQYLNTLDKTDKDDFYGSDYAVKGNGLKGFIKWLKENPKED